MKQFGGEKDLSNIYGFFQIIVIKIHGFVLIKRPQPRHQLKVTCRREVIPFSPHQSIKMARSFYRGQPKSLSLRQNQLSSNVASNSSTLTGLATQKACFRYFYLSAFVRKYLKSWSVCMRFGMTNGPKTNLLSKDYRAVLQSVCPYLKIIQARAIKG